MPAFPTGAELVTRKFLNEIVFRDIRWIARNALVIPEGSLAVGCGNLGFSIAALDEPGILGLDLPPGTVVVAVNDRMTAITPPPSGVYQFVMGPQRIPRWKFLEAEVILAEPTRPTGSGAG